MSCGHQMAPAADYPPSAGNPNQCVLCATGHNLPPVTAPGVDSVRATRDGGPETAPAGGNPTLGQRATKLRDYFVELSNQRPLMNDFENNTLAMAYRHAANMIAIEFALDLPPKLQLVGVPEF